MGKEAPMSEVGATAVVLDRARGMREEVEDGAGRRARLSAGEEKEEGATAVVAVWCWAAQG